MKKTKIQWATDTWNCVIGCRKVSQGCDNCYAMHNASRMQENDRAPDYYHAGLTDMVNGRVNWSGVVKALPRKLTDPLAHTAPKVVFVNSMSDLFHEGVPATFIMAVFGAMALAPQHLFLILTKRPERMREVVASMQDAHIPSLVEQLSMQAIDPTGLLERRLKAVDLEALSSIPWPLPNVWLGVSAEDNKAGSTRIPILLDTPSARRFISAEPLLGPLLIDPYLIRPGGLDWVICGGESGHGARPMHPEWVNRLWRVCQIANVPFWFKQWGQWAPREAAGTFELGHSVLVSITGKSVPFSGFPNDDLQMTFNGYDGPMTGVGKSLSGNLLGGMIVEESPEWEPGEYAMAGKMVTRKESVRT